MPAVLIFLYSCQGEEILGDSPSGTTSLRLNFSVGGTKSSISCSETHLGDVNIYVYSAGVLFSETWTDSPGEGVSIEFPRNTVSRVYALANVGRVSAPVKEEDLPSLSCMAGTPGDFSAKGFPMTARMDVEPSMAQGPLTVELERIVSKINFRLDAGDLGGMRVKSVRLMQTPLDVSPFAAASAASATGEGDYASDTDIESINAGGQVSFYMLENCQGVLLPGNTDPWQKVPDNIEQRAGLCTYMEVGVTFDGSTGLGGPATYRFFLGADNTSDFNVVRNTETTLTLRLTDDALDRVSWRIDNTSLSLSDVQYVLDPPSYPGQWGTVTFPGATPQNLVTVSCMGGTMTVPTDEPAHLGEIGDDSPTLLVCLPSEPNTVYICAGFSGMTISVSQQMRQGTIAVRQSNVLSWGIELEKSEGLQMLYSGETISLNESGEDQLCYLYLCDGDRRVQMQDFAMPGDVMEYIRGLRDCDDPLSHIYWYYDPDIYVESEAKAGYALNLEAKPALETVGESYLYEMTLYGLQADGKKPDMTILRCGHNMTGGESSYFNLEILPAFPNQAHLGAVYNYQMALGSLQSGSAALDISLPIAGNAVWRIGSGDRYQDGDQDKNIADVLNVNDRSLIAASGRGTEIVLDFAEPRTLQEAQYLAGGRYHIRGTLTNPHSERIISGDYSVDIILYLVIGEEVRFYTAAEGDDLSPGTYLDFSYVPVMGRYGADDSLYYDFWSMNSFCKIYNIAQDRVYGFGSQFCTARQVSSFIISDPDNIDAQFSTVSDNLRGYLHESGADFFFEDPLSGERVEKVLYYDPDWSGHDVQYYELHRLQDLSYGTWLIEDYFGSFDNY